METSFPRRRWNSQKLLEEIRFREHPSQSWTAQTEEKSKNIFVENQSGRLQPPFQDSTPGDGEAVRESWSISGNFIDRHHVEPGVKLYVPNEASFPIPLKYIAATRVTNTSLDVVLNKSMII